MMLVLFSNILTGGLRVAAGLCLLSRLLAAEKPGKKPIAAGIAGALAIAAFLFRTNLPDFYRMVLEAVWIAVCAGRWQKADIRMSLFVGSFYEIAVSFWQFLLSAGIGVLFRSLAFLDARTFCGQTSVWLLHLLLILLAVFFSRKIGMSGEAIFRFASMMTLAGFLLVVTLSEQTRLALPADALSMWTILAVVLLMSSLVYKVNRQYEMEKELAEFKSQQAELLERDYTALNHAYAVNAKLFHDFHNHIGALRQLLSHEKYREAIQYLDELQAPIREMTDSVWTGDETVDYLINQKAAEAAADNIQLQAQVEFPRHTNIRSADLCAVLGNLLDNALEAARQVPGSEQRCIQLTIRRIHQMLVIKVENPFLSVSLQENGTLKTTKKENGLHGWGLKSAQTAAEKYDGMVQTTCMGNTFRAVATLSYHGVRVE